MGQDTNRPRRSGRRRGASTSSSASVRPIIDQLAWCIPQNRDAPIEPLDEEGVAAIHNAAMRILEEIGIDFLHDDAIAELRTAGCEIDANGITVRMDRAFVMEKVRLAPDQFTMTPRNPDREVSVGGNSMSFVNVSSPPNVMDL
ncbi:MAG: trimethylamine methyltransferase family protein, partial [Pseudomonadota bacterium]